MRILLSACAAVALLTAAGSAAAQEWDVSFNAAVTSDYVFRGFSQSDEEPAIQGGLDLTNGGFYVGTWASTVDFYDSTDAEVDLYGGYRTEAGGFSLDFGAIAYLYVNAPGGADYNNVEFKAAASRTFGNFTGGLSVNYSPDFYGPVDKEAVYIEATGGLAATDRLTISGGLGHQYLDVSDDYWTWNLGASFALTDNLTLDGRYFDTDVDGSPLADERFVATIKAAF